MFWNLPQSSIVATKPLCFEDLNQGYGFVLYRTKLKNAGSGLLKIKELRDFAIVYINAKRVAILDRHLKEDSVQLDNIPANARLDIFVENNGRINYGPFLTDNRQGITEKVTLGGTELTGWQMFKLPYNTAPKYTRISGEALEDGPVVFTGTFNLTKTGDTYLDMSQFGKGFVFFKRSKPREILVCGSAANVVCAEIMVKGWAEPDRGV